MPQEPEVVRPVNDMLPLVEVMLLAAWLTSSPVPVPDVPLRLIAPVVELMLPL